MHITLCISDSSANCSLQPTTQLESAVDKLLKSAKMREDEIAQTESLKMNHLSVEEVSARRAELAKMRDLMFRAEAKAKRIAKIKSKTYRRIRKKERSRLAEKLGEDSDDDLDDEDDGLTFDGEDEESAENEEEEDEEEAQATAAINAQLKKRKGDNIAAAEVDALSLSLA